jgi:hypothetical protein
MRPCDVSERVPLLFITGDVRGEPQFTGYTSVDRHVRGLRWTVGLAGSKCQQIDAWQLIS